ncbi:MAG: hypothetical protein GY773_21785 [Actinomycetia bacterium]|nr:hypothetical protein [Actinomycetes bacterium]MCP5035232.1 hypothetical protein [Actinomycetes bacterium]
MKYRFWPPALAWWSPETFSAAPTGREGDLDIVGTSGGPIGLGQPLGGTGAFLATKAVYELERADETTALITVCSGDGLGAGTHIERK